MVILNHLVPMVLSALLLVGCAEFDDQPVREHDEIAGLTRDAFEATLNRPAEPLDRPELERARKALERRARPLVSTSSPIDPGPLVTLSVNETVPLKDVLSSLARQAGREIEIDPRIEGGVILSVHNRTFLQVVDRIAELGGLRFDVENGILRVELDEPYNSSYKLSFLDVERRFTSSVSTSVNVFTSGGGGGNGSTNSIDTTAVNDLWGDIEATISQLLSSHAPTRLVDLAGNDVLVSSASGGGSVALATESVTLEEGGATRAAQVSGGAAESVPGGSEGVTDTAHFFTLNRSAGLLSVFATERQHEAIRDYITRLTRSLTSQVLIEAKILEVGLDKAFRTGINWRAVLGDISAAAPLGGSIAPTPGPFDDLFSATADVFSVALDTDDLQGVLSLIENFGTTRTLSSPRVTVMQGHTAVLKVAENQVFFQLTFEREEQESGDDLVTVSSEINTVPVGVVITVQPAIDVDTATVSMTLRPTITRITDTVDDPAVSIASNNTVRSIVPVVAVQEIDSVVKMGSGDTIVMGGLMQDDVRRGDQGVPGLSEIPIFGRLFKTRDETTQQTELVIFLRATIVEDPKVPVTVDPKDIELYERFADDPRPVILRRSR